MRRFVLLFVMLLLPLQWSWAAAASVCGHEPATAHFGHHEHEHEHVGTGAGANADTGVHADADPTVAPDPAGDGSEPAGAHPDCHACHGLSVGVPSQPAAGAGTWGAAGDLPAYARAVPEPPVETFLRPPLSLVA